MENGDFLVKKILFDANTAATSIISDANERASNQQSAAKAQADKIMQDATAQAEENFSTTLSRSGATASLDGRKILLDKKKGLINACFELAEAKILAIDKAKYKELVLGLIAKYADDGDEVVIAKRDADIVTNEALGRISKAKGIKLTLAKKYGEFSGGVLLSSRDIDKNLTIGMLVKSQKDNLESKVLSALKI